MLGDQRWVEVTPSAYEHEREGLHLLRELLPDVAPFRVWTNFEFKDSHGRWHEIDALVLGRSRLHLVELKYYSGDLHGNDLRWHRGQRVEGSPLLLARRKAQRLKQKLQDAAAAFARENNVDPRQTLRTRPVHPGVGVPASSRHPQPPRPIGGPRDLWPGRPRAKHGSGRHQPAAAGAAPGKAATRSATTPPPSLGRS